MHILSLDLSTCLGWALIDNGLPVPTIVKYGRIENEKTAAEYAAYPFGPLVAAQEIARKLFTTVIEPAPDMIVIEETNLGRNRYSQKQLEFIHCAVLQRLQEDWEPAKVKYIDTGTWRRALGIILSKDQRRQNARLSKAKSKAKAAGIRLDKKALGIAGRINKKHIAIQYVNEHYGLNFKMKDNDIADAICLGLAYAAGAEVCDGK